MEEKELSDMIRVLIPKELNLNETWYEVIELRVAFSSLIDALKATQPQIIEKYKGIKKEKDKHVLETIRKIDFEAFCKQSIND